MCSVLPNHVSVQREARAEDEGWISDLRCCCAHYLLKETTTREGEEVEE